MKNNNRQTCRTISYHAWFDYNLLGVFSSSWALKGSGSRIPFYSKASRKKKEQEKANESLLSAFVIIHSSDPPGFNSLETAYVFMLKLQKCTFSSIEISQMAI